MKKSILIGILILVTFACLHSCKRKNREPKPNVIGTLAVDLDANTSVVRKRESLIGNMIADAMKSGYENKNQSVDFALANGGGIRYSSTKRQNGIYTAGEFTSGMADEMLPFGNSIAIVTVTGKQLKEMFERAVANYPLARGNFMQLSKQAKIIVDTTQSAQVLNIDETAIISPGNRIVSIKINNVEYDDLSLYKVGVPDFIAEGNDGYTTLRKLSGNLKEYIGEEMASVLKEYIINNSVVDPKLEGRILFQ